MRRVFRFSPSHYTNSLMQMNSLRYLTITPITMPSLSPTMSTGTLVSWKKQVGEQIKPEEALAEVQTDKAVLDFENVALEGFMAKHVVAAGTAGVAVGDVIALMVDTVEGVNSPEVANYKVAGTAPAAAPQAPSTPAAAAPSKGSSSASSGGGNVPASPFAKQTAKELGVDYRQATPTGADGKRVVADDVRRLANAGGGKQQQQSFSSPSVSSQPIAPAGGLYEEIPVTDMRRVIAQRLNQSTNTEVPHFFLADDVCVDSALKVIAHLREKTEVKVGINDYIVKAIAKASLQVPECNTHWTSPTTPMRRYKASDVAVAVATPSGLITPIVFDADRKGIAEISAEIKSLAAKARDGKLLPKEYQGGTVTISNLGGFSVKRFTAIINQPHSMILAIGTTQYRVKIDPSNGKVVKDKDGEIVTEQYLSVTASFDHRVVDGAVGAQFMKVFRDLMENPLSLLA
eukprot:PhF_6_TR22539/c0_g1_i1/m.32027/K00627/DLAT, aceF, pdhC; pyruvate dehydrogenase E2 component (dihydrolipoamide acetyltransferase)